MMVTRHSTYVIACAIAGSEKVGSVEKIWPLGEKKKLNIKPITAEDQKAIAERFRKRVTKHGK